MPDPIWGKLEKRSYRSPISYISYTSKEELLEQKGRRLREIAVVAALRRKEKLRSLSNGGGGGFGEIEASRHESLVDSIWLYSSLCIYILRNFSS